MGRTLLVDFNNMAIRTVFNKMVSIKDMDGNIGDVDWNLWRFMIVENLVNYLKSLRSVDELVVACDGQKTWRKLYWPKYKETRKKSRDSSPLDWNVFFEKLNELQLEIKENLPFKIIKIRRAEADDIIGSIVLNNNRKNIIISTDKDFLQLCGDNLICMDPIKKEEMKYPDPEMWLVKECLKGQRKDNIWNVKTPLDYPEGKRKPGLGDKAVEKILTEGLDTWLDKNKARKRFEMNKNLIDLRRIPGVLRKKILTQYNEYQYPPFDGIYKYFDGNNWIGFTEDFYQFEKHFVRVYSK